MQKEVHKTSGIIHVCVNVKTQKNYLTGEMVMFCMKKEKGL